ncbi:DUF3601 domain-containing protein [Anaerosinus massiliensis]|uniref:DUF3601 domain-containing protein n=1 Tax=Massilibacillus massiliensis TaxID=1806837 RepID=UPI000DA5EF14|nr:DUF3601 domain-containing protein [Massilibacillus massiliensis]
MIGPKELGFWSNLKAVNIGTERGILAKGKTYRVIKDFIDADGTTHKPGETWVFLAYSFLSYDNGLQWFITIDHRQEWAIPLWLDDLQQQQVDRNLANYIEICN